MKRGEFAHFLGINRTSYTAIERGYLKPTKKQIGKISERIGEDFTPYTEGDYSYPLPLPTKDESKLAKKFYDLCGKLWVKLVILFFVAASGATLGTGFYYGNQYDAHSVDYYSENYQSFAKILQEEGTPTLSITDSLRRPEFFSLDGGKFYSIKGTYNTSDIGSLNAIATYHEDDYRLTYSYSISKQVTITTYYVVYETGNTFECFFSEDSAGVYDFVLFSDGQGALESGNPEDEAIKESIKALCESHLPELNPTFDKLIKDNAKMDYSFYDGLLTDFIVGENRLGKISMISLFLIVMGALGLAANLFFLAFCYIYGRKNNVSPFEPVRINYESLSREPHAKKDFFFTPFLSETFFELLGIFLVFFGSVRVLYYFFTFLGAVTITGNDFTTVPEVLLSFFMVGMFLLYFIDFDIFLDDKRVFRNIVMDFLIFLCLYVLETVLITGMQNSDVIIIKELGSKVSMPNNFGTITCYFIMMVTLFYTPKQIKTEKGMTFFRLLTIIPVSIIIANTLIFHFANTLWGWNLPISVLFLFSSEKTQFSLLCVIYLLGLFFLKLYYEKKYGREKALTLMGGNRFLFAKNSIAALTVLLIGIMEIALSGNKNANTLGLGKYPFIILLAPLLLFYHPHKGERNQALDWTTLILYIISFAGGYLLIVIPFLIIILYTAFA